MIPQINHSRSRLLSYLNDFEEGAAVFGVSSDTFPQLFELAYPDLVKKSPKRWKSNPQGNFKYLWFPPGSLTEDDCEIITDWRERFSHYVLLGLNPHLVDHFTTELDFCMALDYRFDPAAEKRTVLGEAEYQLKYQGSAQSAKVLGYALIDAIGDLPIPQGQRARLCITCVPAPPGERTVPRRLATGVAKLLPADFVDAHLTCAKAPLKGVTVEEKIPIWQTLYADGCVSLTSCVEDRTVIIVDDLYQSGVTMWTYAGFLKEQGARHVFGLPCVKSLRDSDNQ